MLGPNFKNYFKLSSKTSELLNIFFTFLNAEAKVLKKRLNCLGSKLLNNMSSFPQGLTDKRTWLWKPSYFTACVTKLQTYFWTFPKLWTNFWTILKYCSDRLSKLLQTFLLLEHVWAIRQTHRQFKKYFKSCARLPDQICVQSWPENIWTLNLDNCLWWYMGLIWTEPP